MLKQQLERRGPLIKRAASLTKISFGDVQDQYFTVHVWWKDGELIQRFAWDEYYEPSACCLKMSPCQATRLFIRQILTQRGL